MHTRIGQLHDIPDIKAKFLDNGVNTRRVPRIAQKASIKLRLISVGVRKEKKRLGKQADQATEPINK